MTDSQPPAFSVSILSDSSTMVAREDAVLALVAVLALSGPLLRTFVTVSGRGTAVLAIPLVPAGFLAALLVIVGELFVAQRVVS
ncbi:hypothetical protein GCM10025298_13910 [Natronobiforma cellulositropha]